MALQYKEEWIDGLYLLNCFACGGHTIFFKQRMIYPANPVGPAPIDGMPEEIRTHYEEARSIAEASPRAAAALLRLAVQKLCKLLGEKGEKINQDIANSLSRSTRIQPSISGFSRDDPEKSRLGVHCPACHWATSTNM
jgi:Domain of unknown function (DUF4145)